LFQLIRWGAALALCLFLATPGLAFTPDDGELRHAVNSNYGPLSSWEAEMSFPDYPGVTAHLWYARGKWRQEWKSEVGKAVAVGYLGNVSAGCTAGAFPLSPLFVWMVPAPVDTWKSWGVDNATAGYGFCDEAPCYLFGVDTTAKGDSPAVYLDNESQAPLFIRYGSGSGLTTIAYGDFRVLGGFGLPQSVAVTRDGTTLKASVRWIAVNRADGEELYARDALDPAPCVDPPEPFALLRELFRYPAAK